MIKNNHLTEYRLTPLIAFVRIFYFSLIGLLVKFLRDYKEK